MDILKTGDRPRLQVSTRPLRIQIVSDAYLTLTQFGYTATVDVINLDTEQKFAFFIASKSVSTGLESLRQANKGSFAGLKIRVNKISDDKRSPYVVEKLE
ncbi:MAG: hypothetical protein HY611_06640 [Elusimicrobia bacterium]|nr:hypothetical protein [Elusimicrobiota bacterium]